MRVGRPPAALFTAIAGLLVIGGLATPAAMAAGAPYATGFERPAFVPGPLDGQDGWRAAGAAARVQPPGAGRDGQAVVIDGARLPPQPAGGAATRLTRPLGLKVPALATPIVDIAVDVRLAGPSTDRGEGPADNLVSAGLMALPADTAAAAGFGALQLSSSGEAWIVGSRTHDAFRIGVPVDLDRGHRLALRLDFVRRTTQFFVDGRPIARLPFARTLNDDALAAAALTMTAVDAGSAAAYTAHADAFAVAVLKPVAVDVEPGRCPNHRERTATAPLVVALPGSAEFDPADVDPASLRLGLGDAASEIAPVGWRLADVATPYEPHTGKERPDACTGQGADGYADLLVSFDGKAVAAALASAPAGDVRLLRLDGRLDAAFGATPVTGEDIVRLR